MPKSTLKLVEEKADDAQKITILEDNINQTTKMVLIPEENIESIDQSCTYCHSIFLGDFKVYQCKMCNSYYHEPCLEKMKNEIKACRYCGAKITSD